MVTAHNRDHFQVEIHSGSHSWRSDEPVEAGGEDTGPNPYELLLGALAACKIITVKMYARKKGWKLEGVSVSLSTRKVHAKDCEDCESDPNAKVDIIDVQIQFEGDLDEIQENRLLEISERCPVHRTLTSEVKIRTRQGVQAV